MSFAGLFIERVQCASNCRSGPLISRFTYDQSRLMRGSLSLRVEPHPDVPGTFRIIDGEQRWTNSKALAARGREQFRQIPIAVTDRPLEDDERPACLDLHPPPAKGMGCQGRKWSHIVLSN